MIKAIIFDVGGVILDLSSKETLNIPTSLSVLFNISTDKARKIWTGYDRKRLLTGKDTPNEFLQIVVNKLKVKKNTKSLLDKWTTLSLKEKDCYNWQLLDYIKDLRENFKVYILSDTVNVAQDDELTRDIKSRFDIPLGTRCNRPNVCLCRSDRPHQDRIRCYQQLVPQHWSARSHLPDAG